MNYEDSINLLTSQSKFQIRLGLERVRSVLAFLGNPQNKIKIIHIAGTNGKGSVSSVLANILQSAGYKTGLYTSPHLIEYTERIKINGIDISKSVFSEYIEKICIVADEEKIDLTEFEILTSAMYLFFYDNKVDVAVIETGMGGRFDATNTVENKLLSIITSISLDHTDRLGGSVEEIAFEKAGIIENSPVVVISSNNLGFNVVKEVCIEKNAKIITASDDIETVFENGQNYLIYDENSYKFALLGLYQKENMALVFSAVKYLNSKGFNIDYNAISDGLKNIKWRARLEYIKEKNILIDGAHNPDAAIALKKSLDYYFKGQKRVFIYSTINTKDYKNVAEILFNPEDKIYFYEFNHKNAVSYEEYLNNTKLQNNIKKFDISEIEDILSQDGLKIITGSLYMIGDLLKTKLF